MTRDTGSGSDRLAVELVLPSNRRVVLLVNAPAGRDGALLSLQLEPPPTNDQRLVGLLETFASGEFRAPAAAETGEVDDDLPPLPPARTPGGDTDIEDEARDPRSHVTPVGNSPGEYSLASSRKRPITRDLVSRNATAAVPPAPAPPAAPADADGGVTITVEEPERASEDDLPPLPGAGFPVTRTPAQGTALPGASDRPPSQRELPAVGQPLQPEQALPGPSARPPSQRAVPVVGQNAPGQPAMPGPSARPPSQRAVPVVGQTAPGQPAMPGPSARPPSQRAVPAVGQTASPASPPKQQKEYPPEQEPMAGEIDLVNRPPVRAPAPRKSQIPVVGIDFGTSYSSIGLLRGSLELFPDEAGETLLPSVVSFPAPGECLVGWEARRRIGGEAQMTIVSPKRLLGRLLKDPQVSQLVGGLAFRTFAGTDKFVRFEAHGEIYSASDICAMILTELRQRACAKLQMDVTKAVFTVPVGFGTLQRSALEVAARQAGFEPVGLITEPSAAVMAHGFRGAGGTVAVYDFGGGTFDFSVLDVTETAFQVRCSGGDPWLGGDDFDNAMAAALADRFWKETNVDLRNRAVEWQALLFACEAAKRQLSSKSSAEVRADDLLHTASGSKGLRYKVSRREFVKLVTPLIRKSLSVVDTVMSQAGISTKQIDAVVLTGGTSMIPAVREAVTKFFGRKPADGDPDLAVVRGASMRAAEISSESLGGPPSGRTLREVAGRTIGAGPKGGRVMTLFRRDTPLPAVVSHSFQTDSDGQTEMVIALYEDSKSRVDESRTIGHLRYKGLRPAPAGQAKIDFTFRLDQNGILHVKAVVEGREYSKSIRLG